MQHTAYSIQHTCDVYSIHNTVSTEGRWGIARWSLALAPLTPRWGVSTVSKPSERGGRPSAAGCRLPERGGRRSAVGCRPSERGGGGGGGGRIGVEGEEGEEEAAGASSV